MAGHGATAVTIVRGARTFDAAFDDRVFATGFRVDVARVSYLAPLVDRVAQAEGFPELTPCFESTTVPALYLLGLVAARAFGPYLGFPASCPFAARTAVDAMR